MYIRTKDGRIGKVISVRDYNGGKPTFYHVQFENDKEIYNDYELDIIKQTYTLKELFDEFVFITENLSSGGYWIIRTYQRAKEIAESYKEDKINFSCYGAIWTEKGLIYVAKMKGILPNGEIDWELL